jgi:hypothetical protein
MDITKCNNHNCPLKDKCFRFTAPSGDRQSWFTEPPCKITDNSFYCDMFWGEEQKQVFYYLTDIVNERKNNTDTQQ